MREPVPCFRSQRALAGAQRVCAVLVAGCSLGASLCLPAWGADEDDALELQSMPADEAAKESALQVTLEVSLGRIRLGPVGGQRNAHRLSLDARYAVRLGEAWRMSLSDRLDHIDPPLLGQRATINSLREVDAAWQASDGTAAFNLGRVNLRQGPAYGYNPTDYFRVGALRTVFTVDPIALRQARMGTVMARWSQLWSSGSASVALAPKLATGPHAGTASLDLGATNFNHRALLSGNARAGDRLNGTASLLLQRGEAPTFGASFTALATDSLVGHGELSVGKEPRLLDRAVAGVDTASARRTLQAAFGATYTLPTATAVTVEMNFNRSGLDRADWVTLAREPGAPYLRLLQISQASQELISRHAWLVYVSHKGAVLKQLDLTAFVRLNRDDQSRLAWAELRYHWQRFDAALQWQRAFGRADSEFGRLPFREGVQAFGVVYF